MKWLWGSLLFVAFPALAVAPLKFCDVCSGYTISKRGDDVLIRCPGMTEPWMIVKSCKKPVVQRSFNNVSITCGQ